MALRDLSDPHAVELAIHEFDELGRDAFLELVGSQAVTPSGVTIQVYHPAGRPEYGTATAD